MTKKTRDHIALMLSRVWLHQLEAIEQNTRAMQADDDVENLHQFRVALRQTRALLKLCRRYLPQAHDYFAHEFKRVAGITGRVRDLDVQLIEAAHQLQNQNKMGRTDMAPIIEALSCQRYTAQIQLIKMLTSNRFKKLLMKWKAFISVQLLSDLPVKPGKSSATLIKKIAVRQCHRLWQEAKAIKPASSAARLHRLRIRIKRFRYLLLNFVNVFADRKQPFRQLLKVLEQLQTVLGCHQDAYKAVDRLQKILKSKTGKTFSKNTIRCAEQWIELLTQQQQEARDQFFDVFGLFKETRRLFVEGG